MWVLAQVAEEDHFKKSLTPVVVALLPVLPFEIFLWCLEIKYIKKTEWKEESVCVKTSFEVWVSSEVKQCILKHGL